MSNSEKKEASEEKPKRVYPFEDITDPKKFITAVEKQYDIEVIFASLGGSRAINSKNVDKEDDYDVFFIYVFNNKELNTDIGRALSEADAPDVIKNFNKKAVIDYHGYSLDRAVKFAVDKAFIYTWLVSPTIYKSADEFGDRMFEGVDFEWLRESTVSLYKRNACMKYLNKTRGKEKKNKLLQSLHAVIAADYLSIVTTPKEYKNIYDFNKMMKLLEETDRLQPEEADVIKEYLAGNEERSGTIEKIVKSFCESYERQKLLPRVPDVKFLKDLLKDYAGVKA